MTPEELAAQQALQAINRIPNQTPVVDNIIGGTSPTFGAENINAQPNLGWANVADLALQQARIDAENALREQQAAQLTQQALSAWIANMGTDVAESANDIITQSVISQALDPLQVDVLNTTPTPLEFDKLDLSPSQESIESANLATNTLAGVDLSDEVLYKNASSQDAITAFNEKILEKQLQWLETRFEQAGGKERALFGDGTAVSNAGDIGAIEEVFPKYEQIWEERWTSNFFTPLVSAWNQLLRVLPGGNTIRDFYATENLANMPWQDVSEAIAGFATSTLDNVANRINKKTVEWIIDRDTRIEVARQTGVGIFEDNGWRWAIPLQDQISQAWITWLSVEQVYYGIYGDPLVVEQWKQDNPTIPFSQAPLEVQTAAYWREDIDKYFNKKITNVLTIKKRLQADQSRMSPNEFNQLMQTAEQKEQEFKKQRDAYTNSFKNQRDALDDRQKATLQIVWEWYKRSLERKGIYAQAQATKYSELDKFIERSNNRAAIQSSDGEILGTYNTNDLLAEVYKNGNWPLVVQWVNNEFAKINMFYNTAKKRLGSKLTTQDEQRELYAAMDAASNKEKEFMSYKKIYYALAEDRKNDAWEEINKVDLEEEANLLATNRFLQKRNINPNQYSFEEKESLFRREMNKELATIYERGGYDTFEINRKNTDAVYEYSNRQLLNNMNSSISSSNAFAKALENPNPVSVYGTINAVGADIGSKNFDFAAGLRILWVTDTVSSELGYNVVEPRKSYYDYKQNWRERTVDDAKTLGKTYSNEIASAAVSFTPFFLWGTIARWIEKIGSAILKAAKIWWAASKLMTSWTTVGRIVGGGWSFFSKVAQELLVGGIQDVTLSAMLGKNGIDYTEQDAYIDLWAWIFWGILAWGIRVVKRVNNIARLSGSEWLKVIEDWAEGKWIKLLTIEDKVEAMDFYNNIVARFDYSSQADIATAIERNKLISNWKNRVGLGESDIRIQAQAYTNARNRNFAIDIDELERMDEASKLATDYDTVAKSTAYQNKPWNYLIQLPWKWDNRVKFVKEGDNNIDFMIANGLGRRASNTDYAKLSETAKTFYRRNWDVYELIPKEAKPIAEIMKQDISTIEKLLEAKVAIKNIVPELSDDILDNYLLASRNITGIIC